MNERQYQAGLIKRIKNRFAGCHVMKNDPAITQGIPDILILYRNTWAMLEVKMEDGSPQQPNQAHYVEKFGSMSFASFINPATEERVLNELESAFASTGQACLSKS